MKKIFIILLCLFIFNCSNTIKKINILLSGTIEQGIIVEKLYIPEQNNIGTGFVNGKVIMTTEFSAEKFIIFVSSQNKTEKIDLKQNEYFKLNKGDKISYNKVFYGNIFISKLSNISKE